MDESVTLTIGQAEALVLFDLLSGFKNEPQLCIRNDAQRVTLWAIEALLEKALVEPFSPDYEHLLELARRVVVAKYGSSNPPAAFA